MRTMLRIVAAATLASLALPSGAVVGQDVEADGNDVESALFIGNSFTFWNDGVETHVAGLVAAEDDSRAFTTDTSTIGGATLLIHRLRGAGDTIREGDHDVVILQGDIPELIGRIDAFFENAAILDEAVKETGGRTVFFMTWPYERLDWVALEEIVAAHRQVEADLGASVAPVGVAMANALAARPDLPMLGPDAEHETMAGTYLAAAVIYATLFNESPEGLGYRPTGVSEEDAEFLQHIAWTTVQEWLAGGANPPIVAAQASPGGD